ncbi:MAG TPA: hypothetical protein VGF20_14965 [Candidatus Acidoferrum sp.]|jgi:hypothetical protein
MATKKKIKKSAGKKKKAAKKKPAPKSAVRKTVAKRTALKARPVARKKLAAAKKRLRGKNQDVDTVAFEPAGLGARSGGQSGDLQGLSNVGRANSESVDELLEEGNAFEAEVVKGVEDAGDADEGEVHTHEVPEDDVAGEYLDKD